MHVPYVCRTACLPSLLIVHFVLSVCIESMTVCDARFYMVEGGRGKESENFVTITTLSLANVKGTVNTQKTEHVLKLHVIILS